MSSPKRFNESPNHFMVLDAVARGMKKIDSISKVTKLSKDEVQLIVNDLVNQKILIRNEKKGFFGNKKIELDIADTGMKILNTKKQELSEKSDRLQQLYETGDKSQVQSFMDSNRMWIPMMLFSGIMNMMFFASMMSFMGMAMNPTESAVTEGQVDQNTAGVEDSAATADYSDSGSSEMDTTNGGDAGFEGFDGGGFGDF
ncbi:MAG TPA: MarR family transcriptional regulator [Nitrososphaeraceae archaeon]|nr:MarR family transcriptional regulator [Nitrososphaeraceae archaeon]